MDHVIVRPANISDQETIVEFNQCLAQETEGKTLDPATVQLGVQRMLNDTSKGRYFVAVRKDEIVGQIMFTCEWSDWRNGDLLWLQSVYVRPEFRRRGIFRQLFQTIRDLTDASDGIVGIRLYVDKNNTTARATYQQLGFCDPGYLVMESLSKAPKNRS